MSCEVARTSGCGESSSCTADGGSVFSRAVAHCAIIKHIEVPAANRCRRTRFNHHAPHHQHQHHQHTATGAAHLVSQPLRVLQLALPDSPLWDNVCQSCDVQVAVLRSWQISVIVCPVLGLGVAPPLCRSCLSNSKASLEVTKVTITLTFLVSSPWRALRIACRGWPPDAAPHPAACATGLHDTQP